MRLEGRIALAALVTVATAFPAWAQAPAPSRFRLVLNASFWPTQTSFSGTPSSTVTDNPTGFNVGGRPDYRFGRSRRFGAGMQVVYSTASVKLKATPDATEASFDAGGLSVGAGLRVYF